MKLMRKIALIFISITLVSAIIYQIIGNKIIDLSSRGELERGPGRLTGAISKTNGEVEKITGQAREFGEYFSIAKQLDDIHGSGMYEGFINLKVKIEKANVENMFIVDKNFNIAKKIRVETVDIHNDDIKFLLKESKKIINSKDYIKKGFFGGVIATENMPYIVGVKRIGKYTDEDAQYNVIIKPIDNKYIDKIARVAGKKVDLVNAKNVESIKDEMVEVYLYDAKFYCHRLSESIDIYTAFKTMGDGPKYYIRLVDDREVRNSAEKNINQLILYIVLMTIIANILVYYLLKKNVLTRIININQVVNKINEGNDLALTLEDDGKDDEISVLTSDINGMFSRLKDYSDNLEYVGDHDLITSLANRNKIMKQIVELKYENCEFSLFFMDLDNFKRFNDTLGHDEGDKLLRVVAQKLTDYSDKHNLSVGRIGGDEFIVLKKGKNTESEIRLVAEDILNEIRSIYESHNWIYEIKASIGISYYPQHSKDDIALLKYADIAMYNCKHNGGDSFSIFNSAMLEQIDFESNIVKGLANNEFKVYYQPIYDTKSEKILGAEALIRWVTKDGVIPPDKFIPLSKKTGSIVDIDNFVLKEAIKTCKYYLEQGQRDFFVSINASKRFLKQKEIISIITNELDLNKVPYNMLKIEITEDEVIDDFEYTIKLLNEIRKLGIKVSLDDFGVGYSSFNHIKILPVDVIKLDRSLLLGVENSKKDIAIIETIINLCHNLDMRVICEGVETRKQAEILRLLKCDCIQGYYYSRPLPVDEFNKL